MHMLWAVSRCVSGQQVALPWVGGCDGGSSTKEYQRASHCSVCVRAACFVCLQGLLLVLAAGYS